MDIGSWVFGFTKWRCIAGLLYWIAIYCTRVSNMVSKHLNVALVGNQSIVSAGTNPGQVCALHWLERGDDVSSTHTKFKYVLYQQIDRKITPRLKKWWFYPQRQYEFKKTKQKINKQNKTNISARCADSYFLTIFVAEWNGRSQAGA